MRYFLRAAGNTFQVGSSKLTLKLLKVSELSCRGFGGTSTELDVASVTPWVAFDFSAELDVGVNEDGPPLRE